MICFNILTIVIAFACAFCVKAHSDFERVFCYQEESSSCDILLKKEGEIESNNYKVALVDAKNGINIFPYTDTNDTMESVTLSRYGNKYVFEKNYFDSSRAIEFITFTYKDSQVGNIYYYFIDSSIDFNQNLRQWLGKECVATIKKLPEDHNRSLLQAASQLCMNNERALNSSNGSIGNDVLFGLSKFYNGSFSKQSMLIALDSKSKDSIKLDDIGCVKNCFPIEGSVNYIGKINEKTRVKLSLSFDGNSVFGYYFYEKVKAKIKIVGHRDGDKVSLTAFLPKGNESFNGVLDDGQFKGVWVNSEGNKKYSFSFYMMLIQS